MRRCERSRSLSVGFAIGVTLTHARTLKDGCLSAGLPSVLLNLSDGGSSGDWMMLLSPPQRGKRNKTSDK